MDSSWKSRQKCGTAKTTLLGTARYFLCSLLRDNFRISDYIKAVVKFVLTWGDGGMLLRLQVTGSQCTATMPLQWQIIARRPGHNPILN
jgi:hypothetical protein